MGPNDTEVNDFLDANTRVLQANPSLQTLLKMNTTLESTFRNYHAVQSSFFSAHQQVKTLRSKLMTAEADTLEALVHATPVERRAALFRGNTPESKQFKEIQRTIKIAENQAQEIKNESEEIVNKINELGLGGNDRHMQALYEQYSNKIKGPIRAEESKLLTQELLKTLAAIEANSQTINNEHRLLR